MKKRGIGRRGATTVRTLTGRTIERSYPGERAAGRAKTRKRNTQRPRPIVGNVASGGGRTAKSESTFHARRLGEEPLKRKGLVRRRPVGRRA